MENYKGFYFNNSKDQPFYEGGAHFKYKDLYNKLLQLYNIKNNKGLSKKKINLELYLLQRKNNEDGNLFKLKDIKKENSTNQNHRRTRNKKRTNLSKSSSIEYDSNKTKGINTQKRSMDNNIYYNHMRFSILNNETLRISYYNNIFQKIHHNSINKNYHFTLRQNKKNLSAVDENKEKKIIIENNNSINSNCNKNISNIYNNNNKIYNYCCLKNDNKYNNKMPKINNNGKKKNFLNFINFKYNLYDNIFLKNKIKNKLKQNKYNSFINQNSNSSISKIKNNSNNKCIKSIENYIIKKNQNQKKEHCHIKSVDYSSIYLGLNPTKTPTYKIKNEIFNNKKVTMMINKPIYNIKTILNNNKIYENIINQVNKNKSSYAKIIKSQLSLNKSKKINNKESTVKLKRDTQSTEYE